ncbi:MAG: MBL fold metallo-hydrolase [candidate division Zixibacteria bacterium HGW-Zixibacteria-1]|nr:MAG: MBL fold metallo-hydrolase [candidate division Zixibacteria bacterium HGW-Zixibacteria-1]
MQIETIVVSPFETNCYLVWSENSRDGVIIDPGDEDERILERIEKQGINPRAVLLTHGHGDHIAAVDQVKKKLNIPLYIGRGDETMLGSPSANVSAMFGFQISCPPADHIISDSDVIKIGPLTFTVFATPGHSPGGVCYFAENILFCGDTLFYGSIGRTDLPGGSFQQLIDSIDRNILTLPDDIICYPGHGPATSVGQERRNNPFLTGNKFV